MRKIVSIIIVAIFILVFLPVLAEDNISYEINQNSREVTVFGKVPNANDMLTLVILNPNKNITDISKDFEGTVNYFIQGYSGKEGVFSFDKISLNPIMEEDKGVKGILFNKKGEICAQFEFDCYTFEECMEAINSVKLSSAADIDSVCEKAVKTLGISFPLYDEIKLTNKSFVNNVMMQNKSYTTLQEFNDFWKETVVLAALDCKMQDVGRILNEYEEILRLKELPNYEFYSKYLSDEIKSSIRNCIENKGITDILTLRKTFEEAILFESIKKIPISAQIEEVIKGNISIINVDLNAYDKLGLKKYKVNDALIGKTFEKISDFEHSFAEALKCAIGDDNKGGGQSSSAGNRDFWVNKKTDDTEITPVLKEPPEVFSDLNETIWAKEAITYLYNMGAVNGKGDNAFAPNDDITREEFTKILILAFGLENGSNVVYFDDVPTNHWSYPYIADAYKAKLVNGKTHNIFGLSQNVIREEMVVMVYRAIALDSAAINKSYKFSDDQMISEYAKEPIYFLKQTGIIDGIGENKFLPQKLCTRAEAAKVIYEALKFIHKEVGK